jgi:hypothetical protein
MIGVGFEEDKTLPHDENVGLKIQYYINKMK